MRPLRQQWMSDPVKRGMIGSTIEGSFYQVWFGAVSGNFLTGMALYLGAGGFALGVLGATPSMATMLQLVFAPFVVGLQRRRLAIAVFSGLQRFGAALAGLLALAVMPGPHAVAVFVVLQVLSWVFMAPAVLIWHGYMSDLIPPEIRGRYFAGRTAWTTTSALVTVLIYGAILDQWPGPPGFRILYWCAFAGAALNFVSYFLTPELPPSEERSARPLWETIRVPLFRPGGHRTATFFFGAWALTQGLAAPFFPLALMHRLGLSFSEVSILATVTSLSTILSLRFLGMVQDRVGEGRVISVLTSLLAAVPALLLLAAKGGWPVLGVAHVLLGISQGGLHLASHTLNLRLAPSEDRSSYFAFYAVAAGTAGFVTPIAVGTLTDRHLDWLFVVSSVLSLGLALLWHLRLRERVG